jgi:proline-specific peptidase
MSGAVEGWVEHARGRTWYRVVGDTASGLPPLVALHGGPGSTHHYFAPLERLAEDGRAVVLYDQLGCGRSDRPDGVDWSVGVFLDELDALRAALGLERIHLLGTSWGGMLALEHALARPGSLASLVLSSSLASAEEWEPEVRRLRDALPAEARAALERLERAGVVEGEEYRRAMEPFDARHFHRLDPPAPEFERMRPERGWEVYRAMWGPNEWTPTGALRDWDVRPRLHELDVPTLVLRGGHDLCTEAIAATLVRGIAGAREVVFPESSHTPVLEETEAYLAVVGGFLREVEGR